MCSLTFCPTRLFVEQANVLRWIETRSVSLLTFSLSLQLIGKLEEKCNLLPLSHKKALSVDPDEIMYTTPGDVGIYYDDDGQKRVSTVWRRHLFLPVIVATFIWVILVFAGRRFVSILMRFWYLTSAHIPEDGVEGTRVFQVDIGRERETGTKTLLTANYEWVHPSLCMWETQREIFFCLTKNILYWQIPEGVY